MSKLSFYKDWLILGLILILGFGLRYYHYGQFPIAGETLDEYAWSTLGASLIEQRQPASWSAFDAYCSQNQSGYFYQGWPVVIPALDHPPFFALLPGLLHSITTDWWQMPSIIAIRFPMTLLATLNLLLFCLVSRRYLTSSWSHLAGLVYALSPLVVFSSRLVLAENLLQTWLLSFLLIIGSTWIKKLPWILTWLAGLAVLTKTAGLVLPLAVLSWYVWQRQFKPAAYLAGGFCLGLLIWLIYGLAIDASLFWAIQTSQGSRNIGLTTLINRWFLHPTLVRNFYFDGWWYLGWVGLLTQVVTLVKNRLSPLNQLLTLSLAFLVWHTLFMMLSVGERTFHGWYDFTILPIIIWWAIILIQTAWQNKLHLIWWLIWLLLLPSLRWAISFYQPLAEVPAMLLRGLILIGLSPYLVAKLTKSDKLAQWCGLLLLVLILTANVLTIINMNDRVYSEFDRFYLTDRSN